MLSILASFFAFSSAFAANEIYLKGADGEKLVTQDDIQCANLNRGGGGLMSISFRLTEAAAEKVQKFFAENVGTKASLMFCGKPVNTGVITDGYTLNVNAVSVPPAQQKCVRRVAKTKPSC